jgi:hypothetical protein
MVARPIDWAAQRDRPGPQEIDGSATGPFRCRKNSSAFAGLDAIERSRVNGRRERGKRSIAKPPPQVFSCRSLRQREKTLSSERALTTRREPPVEFASRLTYRPFEHIARPPAKHPERSRSDRDERHVRVQRAPTFLRSTQ